MRPQELPLAIALVIGALSGLALLILVLPVVVVLVTSFTESLSLKFPPPAYSLRWYRALFDPVKSAQIHTAALNSLIVAASATAVSAVLGTLAALAIARRRDVVGPGARRAVHVAPDPARAPWRSPR